jgi:hypothetical protein
MIASLKSEGLKTPNEGSKPERGNEDVDAAGFCLSALVRNYGDVLGRELGRGSEPFVFNSR